MKWRQKSVWGLHISGWTTTIATFQTMELFLCFLTFDTCIIHFIHFFKMNLLQATGKSAYKRKRGPWQQCLWYQRGAGAGMASIANRDVFFLLQRRLGSPILAGKESVKGTKWFGRSNDVVWTCGTSLFFCSLFPPPWKLAKNPLGCESNLQVTQHQDSINRFIVIKLVTQTGEPCKHHLGFVSRPS